MWRVEFDDGKVLFVEANNVNLAMRIAIQQYNGIIVSCDPT